MTRWLIALSLLLAPVAAEAEGRQFAPGEPCTIAWSEPSAYLVYLSPTKGDPGTPFATIHVTPSVPPRTWSTVCPSNPGQYYFSIVQVDDSGAPVLKLVQVPFVIGGAGAVFAIGATVKTTALLNVRATPAIPSVILGAARLGAQGRVMDGPVTANSQTWWKITYTGGLTGWSAQSYLVPGS